MYVDKYAPVTSLDKQTCRETQERVKVCELSAVSQTETQSLDESVVVREQKAFRVRRVGPGG